MLCLERGRTRNSSRKEKYLLNIVFQKESKCHHLDQTVMFYFFYFLFIYLFIYLFIFFFFFLVIIHEVKGLSGTGSYITSMSRMQIGFGIVSGTRLWY